jgi:hypothetical protein
MYGYKMGSMECTENMHMRCTEWYKSTCSTRAVWLVPESERERGRERDRQREREREREDLASAPSVRLRWVVYDERDSGICLPVRVPVQANTNV